MILLQVKRGKATEDTAAIEKWIRSCNIYHIFFTLLKTLFYIRDIGDVHRSKPPPTVHYQKAMPDIDDLMQVDSCHWYFYICYICLLVYICFKSGSNILKKKEWPEDFEEELRTTALPTADLAADLTTQVQVLVHFCQFHIIRNILPFSYTVNDRWTLSVGC